MVFRPPIHGPFRIETTGPNVFGGRLSWTTSAGNHTVNITNSNFTSRVVRASAEIILTPANLLAAQLAAKATGVFAVMTNNATIQISYHGGGGGLQASFYFMVFDAGTRF